MSKFMKFIVILVIALPIVIMIARSNHNEILHFKVNGVVTEIIWKSRNHGMPMIKIRDGNKIKTFQSNRITLNDSNLKVGDKIIKASGSKVCQINNIELDCINK